MESSLWEGRRVRLRAVEPGDAEAHWRWNQDSETERSLDRVHFPQSREHARRWAETAGSGQNDGDAFHFEIETLDGVLVGSVATHDCDARNGTFSLGVAVMEGRRRRGYAAEAVRLVVRYYFAELRYQKVTVYIYSFNDASRALFTALGFRQEGRLRRMVYTNGSFFDVLVFGLTADEFSPLAP